MALISNQQAINAEPKSIASPEALNSNRLSFVNLDSHGLDLAGSIQCSPSPSHDSPPLTPEHPQLESDLSINTTSASKVSEIISPTPNYVSWKVHWTAPTKMVGLMFAGLGFSLAHHFYYNSLVGTEAFSGEDNSHIWNVNSQEWKIRFGTAFSVLAKTCFAAASSFAYKEHIWTTMSRKPISIAALDAEFSAISDIFSFLNLEYLKRVKIGSTLALITWLLPLSALITPATLIVVHHSIIDQRPLQAPLVNFSDADLFSGQLASSILDRLAPAVASQMNILSMAAVVPNSSYSMSFLGPSLRCEPPSENITRRIDEIFIQGPLLFPAPTFYHPNETIKYTPHYIGFYPSAWTSSDNYSIPGILNGTAFNASTFVDTCLRATNAHVDFNPGQFNRHWILLCQDGYDYFWLRSRNSHYSCSVQETSYNITWEVSGDRQSIKQPYEWSYVRPLPGAAGPADPTAYSYQNILGNILRFIRGFVAYVDLETMIMDNDPDDGDPTKPCDTSNCYQLYKYQDYAGYEARFSETLLMKASDFVLDPAYFPNNGSDEPTNKTIGELIGELSRNLTLSTFSEGRLWSDSPYNTTVFVSTQSNVYAYIARNLFLAYGLAFFACLFCVLVGLRAYIVNGVSCNTSFSGIVSTTRNPTLDALTKGHSMGAQPLSKELSKVELIFGVLRDPNDLIDVPRLGFGLPHEVKPLRKGGVYY